MSTPFGPKLDARARQLLRTLIAQYIADGQPVGSRTLAKNSGLDVSPATIRNVMADLEEIGLLVGAAHLGRPHSDRAGLPRIRRQPARTQAARSRADRADAAATCRRQAPTQDLLNGASSLLSDVTHFVGVVTVPKREEFPFRHIDFVALGGNRVLVILVFTDNEVQNRVVDDAARLFARASSSRSPIS